MESTAADALAFPRPEPARALAQRELIAMLGMATAAAALGIDTMLPAFGDMRADLGLAPDSAAIGNIITFYFAGMAVGQLFWGPLADRFGRRRTLHVSLVLYALAAVAAALSPTLATVVITRSLWGFAAAGPVSSRREAKVSSVWAPMNDRWLVATEPIVPSAASSARRSTGRTTLRSAVIPARSKFGLKCDSWKSRASPGRTVNEKSPGRHRSIPPAGRSPAVVTIATRASASGGAAVAAIGSKAGAGSPDIRARMFASALMDRP